MKYLLDTHIILWAGFDVKRLSRKAKSILENPENALYFSPRRVAMAFISSRMTTK